MMSEAPADDDAHWLMNPGDAVRANQMADEEEEEEDDEPEGKSANPFVDDEACSDEILTSPAASEAPSDEVPSPMNSPIGTADGNLRVVRRNARKKPRS